MSMATEHHEAPRGVAVHLPTRPAHDGEVAPTQPAGGYLPNGADGSAHDAETTTICGYCSTGCGLSVRLRQNEIVGLVPAEEYPVNLGMACPKGWEALSVLGASDRARVPLARDGQGRLRPIDWPKALQMFCRQFKQIQRRHGPEAVAFLGTGQIATEELAFLGSLAKFGMGMLHGDGNTRQCMATSVVAYKQAFGFDAPPYTYADFEESDAIVLVGSNLCIAHPILWQRVLRNRRQPQIIVLDPRATETAMAATLHVPLAPKSDQAFFYGLAHILLREGWVDHKFVRAHTAGFEEFASHVSAFDPQRVAALAGIEPELLFRVARIIHQAQRASFWWTMGVNQSHQGVRTAQAIINVALLTGNIGRPGTGANSITGQCNAMGSRLFSNTTSLLGGRDFQDPSDRQEVARILNIDAGRIPDRNSWAYDQIIAGILAGKIKGLWVVATNPAHSWINQNMLRDVLDRLDFLVVQDMYASTQTARLAHLVLPAAAWGEKEGTFINSERRIGVIRKVARAPAEALADFLIFRLIARAWGCEEMFGRWTSPERVFQMLKQLSRGRPCDFTGVSGYQMLDEQGGVQWPIPEGQGAAHAAAERRLFADGAFFHADGRARFLFDEPTPIPEAPDDRYPLLLLTGRGTASQWHTQTRTAKSAVLRKLYPAEIYVEVNPADARRARIKPEQRIVVESQRGALLARAFVTQAVRPGQVFVPMHYETANRLTLAHFDPHSRQPAYKDCAVRIRPCERHDLGNLSSDSHA
jgi:assimilatory nitrate reductase catalytic subunit